MKTSDPSIIEQAVENPSRSALAHSNVQLSNLERVEEIDPARQSLSDALRVSFWLLKMIMIILAGIYCFSGIFSVPQQQVAVRLQFGRIISNEQGDQVARPGLHIGLPYPIERVIYVPTSPQILNINQAFWYDIKPGDRAKTKDEIAALQYGKMLNPEMDGSLLTGDANIVHARYEVTYRVTDPVAYVENIGDETLARSIMRNIAEQAIVYSVAQIKADDFIGGRSNQDLAGRYAQRILDEMNTGLSIETFITAGETEMPLPVRRAYEAVINAENEKAQQIEAARQEYARILGETAGQAYEPLLELVQSYETAVTVGQPVLAAELGEELDRALIKLEMTGDRGGQAIGGKVSELVNEAVTYKTQVVEQVKAEAETFRALRDEYLQNPQILTTRLWEDARQEILSGDVETMYAPPGEHYIVINRDPEVIRLREEERLRRQQERLLERK